MTSAAMVSPSGLLKSLLALVGLVLCDCPSVPVLASETKSALETIYIENEAWSRPGNAERIFAYLQTHPNDPDVLCFAARIAIERNRLAQARQYYARAVAAQPNHARALSGLSYCELMAHNYKKALELGRKSVDLDQFDTLYIAPNVNLVKNMQILYHRFGDTKAAAAMAKKLRAYEQFDVARSYREKGALDKAIATLDKIIKDDPKMACAYLLRGVIFNNRSAHAKAIKDFDRVIVLQPSLPVSYYLRGDSYFELGNKQKALESWRAALGTSPVAFPGLIGFEFTALTGRFREHFEPVDQNLVNRADIYFLCGVAESDLKRYQDAANDYSRCIAVDPGEYKAYFERARVHERGKIGSEENIVADFTQAIKINPRYIDALLERAKIYEKRHQNGQAMADYSTVIQVNPDDFGSYILRADLAYRLKNYEQALFDFNRAIQLSPTDDEPYIGRARVYTAQNKFDAALSDYRKAISLNKADRAVVLDAIARVEKLKAKSR
ncbi:MAG: tetratricopeptide repeat protein [Cyanobacteria bacterium REEB67]|nr:tetratricopeptide repeat protein [Cyanobacteria bacterium REEB67]